MSSQESGGSGQPRGVIQTLAEVPESLAEHFEGAAVVLDPWTMIIRVMMGLPPYETHH